MLFFCYVCIRSLWEIKIESASIPDYRTMRAGHTHTLALWKNCLKTSRTYENFPRGTCRTKKEKLRDLTVQLRCIHSHMPIFYLCMCGFIISWQNGKGLLLSIPFWLSMHNPLLLVHGIIIHPFEQRCVA